MEDEQHREGARITLELNGRAAPFSITCGIYGLFVHTAFFSDERDACEKYAKMRNRIDQIVNSEQHEIFSLVQAFCDEF